jgi:hypothetical protein
MEGKRRQFQARGGETGRKDFWISPLSGEGHGLSLKIHTYEHSQEGGN